MRWGGAEMMCVPVSIADILGQVESNGWREKQNVSWGNTTLGLVFTTSPPKYLV